MGANLLPNLAVAMMLVSLLGGLTMVLIGYVWQDNTTTEEDKLNEHTMANKLRISRWGRASAVTLANALSLKAKQKAGSR